MRERYEFWHALDVRWGDMDAQGHINNARYFTYFESARIAFFDHVDLRLHGHDRNEGPALVTTTANFRRQVRYPARLEIGVRLVRIGNRSIGLEMAAFMGETDDIAADATSVNAWVDYNRDVSADIPDSLRDVLTPYLRTEP